MKNMRRKKRQTKKTNYDSTTIGEGERVIDERGGKDVDLYEFDASTCYSDRFYDTFNKYDEIITEGSIVWLSNNKTIWEGSVIKNPFSNFHSMPKIWN